MKVQFIEIDKGIRSGEPRVKNTRLTVLDIVLGIYYDSFESYIIDHDLNKEIGIEVLEFCSSKLCLRTQGISFCNKCVFGKLQTGETYESLIKEYDKITVLENNIIKTIYSKYSNSDLTVDCRTLNYLGSEEEFWEEIEGYKGWEISKTLLDKFKASKSPST